MDVEVSTVIYLVAVPLQPANKEGLPVRKALGRRTRIVNVEIRIRRERSNRSSRATAGPEHRDFFAERIARVRRRLSLIQATASRVVVRVMSVQRHFKEDRCVCSRFYTLHDKKRLGIPAISITGVGETNLVSVRVTFYEHGNICA